VVGQLQTHGGGGIESKHDNLMTQHPANRIVSVLLLENLISSLK
jgi:hypothetical protein